MRAFVMAAGKGTRLAPLTDVLPKPAIPVANEPVMGHLLRLLARNGVRDVVSNISYKADEMRRVFGDGSAWGVTITWSHETELLGTAGGMKRAEQWLRHGDEPVVVLSGDGLHDVDIAALAAAHRQSGALATIALCAVSDPSEYGVAIVDERGMITAFQEKPAPGDELSNLANTGIYVFDPEVFDLIPEGFYDFGSQLFPLLVEQHRPILGVTIDGYWNDIGGLEEYRYTNLAVVDGLLSGLELPACDERFTGNVLVHPAAQVAPDVQIAGPAVIGAGATIGAGARLSRVVVLPGARVPEGALVAGGTVGDAAALLDWAHDLASHDVTVASDPAGV